MPPFTSIPLFLKCSVIALQTHTWAAIFDKYFSCTFHSFLFWGWGIRQKANWNAQHVLTQQKRDNQHYCPVIEPPIMSSWGRLLLHICIWRPLKPFHCRELSPTTSQDKGVFSKCSHNAASESARQSTFCNSAQLEQTWCLSQRPAQTRGPNGLHLFYDKSI